MNESFQRHDPPEEDRQLRQALETMPLPLDVEAFQERVLRRVQKKPAVHRPQAWFFNQEAMSWLCLASSLAAALVFLFHFLWTVDSSPLLHVESPQSGFLSGLIRHYRAASGQEVLYPKGAILDLRDGSQITCLSNAECSIALTPNSRQVRLADGVLQIQAAKNEAQPFRVQVFETEIQVTGTKFIVSTSDK